MRKVHAITEPNAKVLLLYEKLADYERRTTIKKTNQHKNTPVLPTIPYLLYLRQRNGFAPYHLHIISISSPYHLHIISIPSPYHLHTKSIQSSNINQVLTL